MPTTSDNRGGGRYSNQGGANAGGSGQSSSDNHYSGSTFSYVYNYLKHKGLSSAAIAAIMGNWRVESNFNPQAYNANEGAVGLAQWEGGRRYSLQHFAASRGTSEWDLQTQLDFFWHEFTGGYSSVKYDMSFSHDPAQLAAVFDSEYEGSAGTTRGARIAAARQFLSSNFHDPGYTTHYSGNLGAAGGGGPSGGGSSGGGGGGSGGDAYSGAVEGFSLRVLDAIPQLRGLLDEARSGNWSTEKFVNEVENSQWYREHSATAREALASQISDPATWQNNINQVVFQVDQLAGQTGFSITHQEAVAIATNALLTGNDNNNAWLTYQLAHKENYASLKSTDQLAGQMAGTVEQLRQIAGDYGITPQPQWVARSAQNIVDGQTTLDTYRQLYLDRAKSMFPALSDQLDKGVTVSDIAQPYIQSMSNLLEMDPNSLSVETPLIRRALQGSPDPTNKSTIPQVTPVWMFENQVRQDPRWAFTDNAHQTMSSLLRQVGQDWGFST